MAKILNFNKKTKTHASKHDAKSCLDLREKIEKSIWQHYDWINKPTSYSERQKLFFFYKLLNYQEFGYRLLPDVKLTRWDHFKALLGIK
jgi:hypothetical protein